MGEKTSEVTRSQSFYQERAASGEPLHLSDVDRLHAEIERTRLEMSRTLDEIRTHMSRPFLKERLKERAREASFGRARRMVRNVNSQARAVKETMRDNPVPTALAGIGAFWLAKKGIQAARSEEYLEREYEIPSELEHERPMMEAEELLGVTPEEEGGTLGRFEEAAGRAREEKRERAREFGERARRGFQRYRGKTREKALQQRERIRSNLSRMFEERPLVMTIGAVALGAIIASLIPETRREHELFGEPREQFSEKVRVKAQESFEKAKTAVEERAKSVEGTTGTF